MRLARELPWRRWMPKFVRLLEETGNVSEAIRRSPRCRRMVYQYRDRCEPFRAAWVAALEPHAKEKK